MECPGQDNVVLAVQQEHDHCACVPDTCKEHTVGFILVQSNLIRMIQLIYVIILTIYGFN